MRAQEFIAEIGPRAVTQQQIKDMADLYASGFTTRDIARDYNVDHTTVGEIYQNCQTLPSLHKSGAQLDKIKD